MTTTSKAADTSTYAIFTTGNFDRHTDSLHYVTEGEDENDAFDAFADDLFSGDGSVGSGWVWHVYEIPSEIADDDAAIYEYVAGRSPIEITS